jgi:hypothetical protein
MKRQTAATNNVSNKKGITIANYDFMRRRGTERGEYTMIGCHVR